MCVNILLTYVFVSIINEFNNLNCKRDFPDTLYASSNASMKRFFRINEETAGYSPTLLKFLYVRQGIRFPTNARFNL